MSRTNRPPRPPRRWATAGKVVRLGVIQADLDCGHSEILVTNRLAIPSWVPCTQCGREGRGA